MLGQEKSSEYVLAELFGEADALDFGKGLFESEPTFAYLGERVCYKQGSTLWPRCLARKHLHIRAETRTRAGNSVD